MRNKQTYCLFLFAALFVGATHVGAQTQRTGDGNARAMQQLQQLNVERTQLKGENEQLKKELEQLKKQAADATRSETSLQQRLKASEAVAARDGATTQQNIEALEKARSQLQELIGRFRDTAQTLKEVETDRSTLRGQLQVRDRELSTCIDRNAGLYDLNQEVLNRYENKGLWSSLTAKEPFTRIQRARLENLIDNYKERAQDLHLDNAKK